MRLAISPATYKEASSDDLKILTGIFSGTDCCMVLGFLERES
jgi:hypothetical protein